MYGSIKFAITSVAGRCGAASAACVRVSAVHPGVVKSEFQDQLRATTR